MTDPSTAQRRNPTADRLERVRGARPEDPAWRADALAGSRHSRWIEELRQPLEDHDLGRAIDICGRVARLALRDYAPAMTLLPPVERLRAKAVTAYALTLFDFVRQSGLEGDRLTAINRWEFELENALDGQPTGQPVFVLLAHLEGRRPFAREGFDQLLTCARHRCATLRPGSRQAAENEARRLGRSLAWLLLGREPTPAIEGAAAAAVRLRALTDLGHDLRRHRCRLPATEVANDLHPQASDIQEHLDGPIRAECVRLRPLLELDDWQSDLPSELLGAGRYCRCVGLALLGRVERATGTVVERAPTLGLLSRILCLARSRWFSAWR